MWYDVVWCGGVWCGVVWSGVVWCGVVWCGGVWCGVVLCGVVWYGVVWCGVLWCGVVWWWGDRLIFTTTAVKYILEDDEQKKRLNIHVIPFQWGYRCFFVVVVVVV